MSKIGVVKKFDQREIENVAKSVFGNAADGTILNDPLALKGRKSVHAWDDLYKSEKPYIKMYKDYMENRNATPQKAMDMVRKSIGDESWRLPFAFIPGAQILQPQLTPAVDFIPTVTSQRQWVNVKAYDDLPEVQKIDDLDDPEWDAYEESDLDQPIQREYKQLGVYVTTGIEERLQIFSDANTDPIAIAGDLGTQALKEFFEDQLFRGNYFKMREDEGAVQDWNLEVDTETVVTTDENDVSEKDVQELFKEYKASGGNIGDAMIFANFSSALSLEQDLQDRVRYNDPGATLEAGQEVMTYKNRPVFETHGLEDPEVGEYSVILLDGSEIEWRTAQEMVQRDLPRDGAAHKLSIQSFKTPALKNQKRVFGIEQE